MKTDTIAAISTPRGKGGVAQFRREPPRLHEGIDKMHRNINLERLVQVQDDRGGTNDLVILYAEGLVHKGEG